MASLTMDDPYLSPTRKPHGEEKSRNQERISITPTRRKLTRMGCLPTTNTFYITKKEKRRHRCLPERITSRKNCSTPRGMETTTTRKKKKIAAGASRDVPQK